MVHGRLWVGLSGGRGEGRDPAVTTGGPCEGRKSAQRFAEKRAAGGKPPDPGSPSPHHLPKALRLVHSPVSQRRARAPFQKEKMETAAGTEIPGASSEQKLRDLPADPVEAGGEGGGESQRPPRHQLEHKGPRPG